MKIVFCGTHIVGEKIIPIIYEAGYKIEYIITAAPDSKVVSEISGFFDYSRLAKDYDIPIYYFEKYSLKGERDVSFFKENKFDLLVQGGWQRLFPDHVIESLSRGAIGLHGSPDFLPRGRGRSPKNWSLINGKDRFLLHMFMIELGVDDGSVFDVEQYDITPFDDIETLYMKYSIAYRKMLRRNLKKIEKREIDALPQLGEPSYFKKRTPEDAEINFQKMSVKDIYNFVRAQTKPYPGAFTKVWGKKYRIWKCRIFDTRITYPEISYGEIIEYFDKKFLVNCLEGILIVDEYEIEE